MKFNQELIQKLRNGEVSIDKQQNIELVKAVLKEAFPDDSAEPHTYLVQRCKFGRSDDDVTTWIQYYNIEQKFTSLPTHSIEDFIEVEIGSTWKEKYNTSIYKIDEVCNNGSLYVLLGNGKELNLSKLEILLQFEPIQMTDLPKVEPKEQKQYMVIIKGKYAPKMIHTTFDSAEKEAKRLLTQELNDTRLDEVKATIVSVEKTLTATKTITIS